MEQIKANQMIHLFDKLDDLRERLSQIEPYVPYNPQCQFERNLKKYMFDLQQDIQETLMHIREN